MTLMVEKKPVKGHDSRKRLLTAASLHNSKTQLSQVDMTQIIIIT